MRFFAIMHLAVINALSSFKAQFSFIPTTTSQVKYDFSSSSY